MEREIEEEHAPRPSAPANLRDGFPADDRAQLRLIVDFEPDILLVTPSYMLTIPIEFGARSSMRS